MITTNVEVGFYTDVFGNEITEYAEMPRYSVCYEGCILAGDSSYYNEHDFDSLQDAMAIYIKYGDFVWIRDNTNDFTFHKGKWSC